MAPLVSLLKEHGYIEARSVHQRSSFEAGVAFARAEGILPAPEPSHAIRVAIDEANAAKEAGEARVILFNLCGHGHFDLSAYERYLDGSLEDYEYPAEKVEAPPLAAACPASADGARLMPRLACWKCGRQLYTVSPLESLFAEERRCPRCGANLNPERRESRAARDDAPRQSTRRSGPPDEDERRVAERARRCGGGDARASGSGGGPRSVEAVVRRAADR